MSFLKVRTAEELAESEQEQDIQDGKILDIQAAHVRLQEAMVVEVPIIPSSKLETQGTEKSPLDLGKMTKDQATRRSNATKSSPKSSSSGGVFDDEEVRQQGLRGGLCRVFYPYISKDTRPPVATLDNIPSPAPPYKFETDEVSISSKDFAYLVKWCQNHNTTKDLKTIRGVQANKLSYDKRTDKLVAPNRLFEATLLLSLFDGNTSKYDECQQLCKFLYSVQLWEFDSLVDYPDAAPASIGNVRFSNDVNAFTKLSPFCQNLFIQVQYFYSDYIGKAHSGQSYWFSNSFDLREILTGGMASSRYCFSGTKLKDILFVTINEYSNMSLHGQIIIMRNAVYLKDNIIYVALNTKNEVGKLGRQYSTITDLSNLDRAFISSLEGYDMEAAMQTIMLYLVPGAEVPFFHRYIKEKKTVRKEISTLMDWVIDYTKEVFQAIIMGQGKKEYTDKLEEEYGIYTERDLFVDAIKSHASDDTLVAKYARKRTKDKHSQVKVNFKKMTAPQARSFMFFYWTYYERKIQDAMVPLFPDPLPLHDAVYTQGTLPLISDVEKEIKKRTGITMKLGVG